MGSPRVLAGVGFLMLLLTSLQGWGMVGLIALAGPGRPELLAELRRLHNLGLSGGLLAVAFGLTLAVLPVPERRATIIGRVLLPSLLVAPIAFGDRLLALLAGTLPRVVQGIFFGLQALSALGITVALVLIVVALFRDGEPGR